MFWASVQGQKLTEVVAKIKKQYQKWEEENMQMDLTNAKTESQNVISKNGTIVSKNRSKK